jgi:hypothetical protein
MLYFILYTALKSNERSKACAFTSAIFISLIFGLYTPPVPIINKTNVMFKRRQRKGDMRPATISGPGIDSLRRTRTTRCFFRQPGQYKVARAASG